MLFQWEMGKQDPSRIEDGFWKNARAQKSTREFANQLFENAAARAAELDPIISSLCPELAHRAHCGHRPRAPSPGPGRIAHHGHAAQSRDQRSRGTREKFSSEDAAPFINGILDAAVKSFAEKTAELTVRGPSHRRNSETFFEVSKDLDSVGKTPALQEHERSSHLGTSLRDLNRL